MDPGLSPELVEMWFQMIDFGNYWGLAGSGFHCSARTLFLMSNISYHKCFVSDNVVNIEHSIPYHTIP